MNSPVESSSSPLSNPDVLNEHLDIGVTLTWIFVKRLIHHLYRVRHEIVVVHVVDHSVAVCLTEIADLFACEVHGLGSEGNVLVHITPTEVIEIRSLCL
jgi:hypothetical protein